MWKYNCEKRNKYYDEVIRLHTEKGMGCSRIAKIFPVGESTISRWIRNFASENQITDIVMKQAKTNPVDGASSSDSAEVKNLQAEISRLRDALAQASLKVAAYNEMINVAEKQFNISIRKKAGAKQ